MHYGLSHTNAFLKVSIFVSIKTKQNNFAQSRFVLAQNTKKLASLGIFILNTEILEVNVDFNWHSLELRKSPPPPLRGNSFKTTHYLISYLFLAQYPERYCKISHWWPYETEHPKQDNENPCLFYLGVPLPAPQKSSQYQALKQYLIYRPAWSIATLPLLTKLLTSGIQLTLTEPYHS